MIERSGTSLVAAIPDGANVVFGPGALAYFVHPEHPARAIEIAEVNASKPTSLEDWLALGEAVFVSFTPA